MCAVTRLPKGKEIIKIVVRIARRPPRGCDYVREIRARLRGFPETETEVETMWTINELLDLFHPGNWAIRNPKLHEVGRTISMDTLVSNFEISYDNLTREITLYVTL